MWRTDPTQPPPSFQPKALNCRKSRLRRSKSGRSGSVIFKLRKAPSVVSPPSSNPFTPFLTLDTAQVEVSYTPDVFGLVRREVETDEALAAVQQFQVEATYLTLTSNVVAAAIQEASLRGQIAATKKIIAIESDLLRLLRIQKKLGQVVEQMWHCKRRRSRKRKRPCRRSRSNWRYNAIC